MADPHGKASPSEGDRGDTGGGIQYPPSISTQPTVSHQNTPASQPVHHAMQDRFNPWDADPSREFQTHDATNPFNYAAPSSGRRAVATSGLDAHPLPVASEPMAAVHPPSDDPTPRPQPSAEAALEDAVQFVLKALQLHPAGRYPSERDSILAYRLLRTGRRVEDVIEFLLPQLTESSEDFEQRLNLRASIEPSESPYDEDFEPPQPLPPLPPTGAASSSSSHPPAPTAPPSQPLPSFGPLDTPLRTNELSQQFAQ
jgi:hypothetical protein